QEADPSSSSTSLAAAAADVKAAAAAAAPRISFVSCYITPSPIIGLMVLQVPRCCFLDPPPSQQQQQQQQQREAAAAALCMVLEDGRLQVVSFQGFNLLFDFKPEGKAVLQAATDKRAQ
ncbi:hypothetical protein, conserved, partial [Eimeria tenella]